MKNTTQTKLKFFFLIVLITAFVGSLNFAQDKKELNKKLSKIDGKVTKISIQTDQGIVEFTGKEAEEMLKKLKQKENKFVFTVGSDSIFDGDHNVVFFSDDNDDFFDVDIKGIKEKVKVEEIDGNKVVTIETTKDGKSTVKKLTGKEAEEYLGKHKVKDYEFNWKDKDGKKIKVKKIKVNVDDKDWVDKEGNVIILKDNMKKHFIDKDDLENHKEIQVTVKDGITVVTVTETIEGKEVVNTFKGKEAEEYIENLKDTDNITIDIKDKDKVKTIIIEKKTDKDK